MFKAAMLAAALCPVMAFSAGGGDTSPPKTTPTTTTCEDGQIWDEASKACISSESNLLDDDTLYRAVREFAYAGQYLHAQTALSAMSDQTDDRVLTYWGFTHRKMGDLATGMQFYNAAIQRNPTNILARSYMGQALVEMGDLPSARVQLAAIRDHEGAGTWAEASLDSAIRGDHIYEY